MFTVAELRSLVEDLAPRSGTVEVKADLPERLDVRLDAEETALPAPFFETEGRVRETPSGFVSSGDVTVYRERPTELHELRIVDDPFAVEGSHVVPVNSPVAGFVGSSETVRAVVDSFLTSVSETVGSEVSVYIDAHASERTQHRGVTAVDADYTARLDGLRDAAGMRTPTVDEAAVDLSRGDETEANWSFDLRNHGTLSAVSLNDRGYEGAEKLRRARQRSGFAQEVNWTAENRRGAVSAEVSYTSENTATYLEELRDTGVPTPARSSFDLGYNVGDGKTSLSLDFETDGEPTASLRDRLGAWTAFVPLPVAPVVYYIS